MVRFPRLLTMLLLLACVTAIASPPPKNSEQIPNGISVGQPKIYDNRTLTIMLESLGQTLQGMQSFVNPTTLAAALANLQGTRTTENLASVSVEGLPIPSLKTTTNTKTGNVSAAGEPLPDTKEVETIKERAAFTPTSPTLADAPALTGFSPQFGASAGDLLNDQINLTYQIFNLRMILERSLSDRLIEKDPRLQAVLGFNVTIDPPRTAVDSVAVVEIALKSTSDKPVSLVAMMPQEKTYNAATLSTKARQFGGTAVASAFEFGVNTRRRRQTFYLYRDNDTVAYERMKPDTNEPKELVFGWTFRPVLGRRAVSPGLRQMLAVVALPAKDLCIKNDCSGETLQASIRTYWKRYDADTLTSFEQQDANRATRFKYATTLGLTRPEIFQTRYTNRTSYDDVVVKPTAEFDSNLGPVVTNVTWKPVGPKSALVSAAGKNFFTGTQLILGDKRYTAGDGLILKSNNAFELVTTIDALSSGPGMISGRYGRAVPFTIESEAYEDAPRITITKAVIGPSLSGMRRVELTLRRPHQLPQDSAPLVTINGNTMPLPYQQTVTRDAMMIVGAIPDSFVSSGSRLIKVSWPFLPDPWTAVTLQTIPKYELARLGPKSFVLQTEEPSGFVFDENGDDLSPDKCWQLVVDGKPMKVRTSKCPSGNKQTRELTPHHVLITFQKAPPDNLILVDFGQGVHSLEVPKAATDAAASGGGGGKVPTPPAAPKALTVNQFDSVFIELAVKSAAKVTAVEANQQPLRFTPKADDDKTIRVQLTRDLTAQPGNVDITIVEDGKPSTSRLVIAPCETCKKAEK